MSKKQYTLRDALGEVSWPGVVFVAVLVACAKMFGH